MRVLGVDVRAAGNQQCGYFLPVAMCRRMQRRRAPMIVLIMIVDLSAGVEQYLGNVRMAIPSRTVQRRRAILVASAYQRGIALE